ncbi:hypothetical protein [Frankia sp. Cj5]|uniref:hypothetical protein n=1 Tax=Frankia sp. Cj5 TaxID=2880978 RepID=UPI001EF494FA|nr:hypothetical protein [Frankia sp. Cj5]
MTEAPDWAEGPVPLGHRDIEATDAARRTYFSPPCTRVLYGDGTRPSRWHRLASVQIAGGEIFAVELVIPDLAGRSDTAFAIFHINSHQGQLRDLLRSLAGRRGTSSLVPDLEAALQPWALLFAGRPYTVAFLSSTEQQLPRPLGARHVRSWSRAEQWLWLLASRTSPDDYPPDPDHADQLLGGTVVLSGDWRGLVTRDGAAFVGLRRDRGDRDPFLGYAQLYAHTTYLDAILLGMIQRSHIEAMVDEAARAFDADDMPRHLPKLEEQAARFRSIYWLRDASAHGSANDILTAYQSQHRLPERFDAVLAEIADLNRIVQTQEGQRVAAALGLLTVVGLPFGTAFGVLQIIGTNSLFYLMMGLLAASVTTVLLLLTRLGRLLIRELRRLE